MLFGAIWKSATSLCMDLELLIMLLLQNYLFFHDILKKLTCIGKKYYERGQHFSARKEIQKSGIVKR